MDFTQYDKEDVETLHAIWEEAKRHVLIDDGKPLLQEDILSNYKLRYYIYDDFKDYLIEKEFIYAIAVIPTILKPSEKGLDFTVIDTYQRQLNKKKETEERQKTVDELNKAQLVDIAKARKDARTANVIALISVAIALGALMISITK